MKTGVLPIYQPGGTATFDVYDTWGNWSWGSIDLPGTTTYIPYTRATHTRSLSIRVLDGSKYRAAGEIEVVWAGDTVSTGRSGDLREILNYLLVGTFEHFGQDTGKAKKTTLIRGDSRVRQLKQE